MYKLAIFDMDGTLLDTLEDLAGSCNYALRKAGFPEHHVEGYKEFIGSGPLHLIRSAIPEDCRDDDTVLRVRGYYHEHYSVHSRDNTKPYDGVTDALKAFKAAGMSVAVCTNKPQDDAQAVGEMYFPGLIDMTAGFRDGVEPKPNPASGLEIMERFGVAKRETVYIGDSGVDMRMGKNLGVTTVGVGWGFRPKTELVELGADVIIDKASELVQFILDKRGGSGIY